MTEKLRVGTRTIEISRRDKVLFPGDGYTKGDLIDYYYFIAPLMVPHLRGRPLMLHRFPDGLAGFNFYQKAISDYYPDWIHRATVTKDGGTITHVICDDSATLVYLANQACVTLHPWLSRADLPDNPDMLVLDLDPPADDPALVRRAALAARELLQDELALAPALMSTGSRGVHLRLPLDRRQRFATVRAFARGLAELLARRHPDFLTVEMRKNKRAGRVFVDALRNSYAATAVAPYSPRARAGAPIAAPLSWAEIEDAGFHPRRYDLKSMQQRPRAELDPWAHLPHKPVPLKTLQRRLDQLLIR